MAEGGGAPTDIDRSEKNKNKFVNYLKEEYERQFNNVMPIPFEKEKLRLDRAFVKSGIEVLGDARSLDSHHNIFHEKRKCKRRIILGGTGYGKSTLALQFAYDWCNKTPESVLKDYDICILLRLRQLGGIKSLYEAIRRFILPKDSTLDDESIQGVLKGTERVVIILDGFDEYPNAKANSVVMKIIMGRMHRNIEVILTTRRLPKHYPQGTQKFLLTGFDETAQDYYIKKCIKDEYKPAIEEIKCQLNDNAVLKFLCNVPLFFVMFVHLIGERKEPETFKTITGFFQSMVHCFHSHAKNKMENCNVQKYYLFETNHLELDKFAFDSINQSVHCFQWGRQELRSRLGNDMYEQYVKTGILVEEDRTNSTSNECEANKCDNNTVVTFYNQVFCEWYAAHFLARMAEKWSFERMTSILKPLNPLDLQYFFCFACGLNRVVANKIMEFLQNREGSEAIIALCLAEKSVMVESSMHVVKQLCSKGISITREQNQLQQRSLVKVLEIATEHSMTISKLEIKHCFSSANRADDQVNLSSGIILPILTTLKELHLLSERNIGSKKEYISDVLYYALQCTNLKKLSLESFDVPTVVSDESLSSLESRNVTVVWKKEHHEYHLNLHTGSMELPANTQKKQKTPPSELQSATDS